ncbi:MAG TPA: transaldolase [Candidatus Binataceae bacterium]
MARSPLRELEAMGQSLWLDYIRRDLFGSEPFRRLLEDDGLKGMTSNPTIFEKAIAGSAIYDSQLDELARQGNSVDAIYEAISQTDIRLAADALRPIYDRSGGRFGYVSYEVSPELSRDTEGTLLEARRFFAAIDRPNLMIKIPGTPEGIPAIEQLIADGRNINVTLMFSMVHYDAVAEAYLRGLERAAKLGKPLDRIASVASVFVSRIDTLLDKTIDRRLAEGADPKFLGLKGRVGVANSKLIYQRFKVLFHGARFKALAAKGAKVQQPLWASTGTKNPAYSDIMYVQELIGPQTVNTMPPATMDAYRDHGAPRLTLEEGLEDARAAVQALGELGIELGRIGDQLQREGEQLFAKSFADLRAVIQKRRDAIAAKAAS